MTAAPATGEARTLGRLGLAWNVQTPETLAERPVIRVRS